ncbi:MAG: hypothetical protein HOP31_12180, partial [Ignavibacteria bacterium]|nr:hypothetical protein [Ignavibacteria bacterium]
MILDTTFVQMINLPEKNFWDYIKDFSFLITLVLGTIIGYGVNRYNEFSKFKKTRIYFFHSLFLLKEAINNQIINYENFLELFKKENDQIPDLELDSGFILDNIRIVAKEDLFKIFILKGNADIDNLNKFNFIIRSLTVIQSFIDSYSLQRKNLLQGNRETLSQYNDLRKKIRDLLQPLLKNPEKIEEMKNALDTSDKIEYDFDFDYTFGIPHPKPTTYTKKDMEYPTPDNYDFFLKIGTLK